jgi:hypothetical protein
MERTLRLALNRFAVVPAALQVPPGGVARADISINLASLYHQYFLDSYGTAPPDPDPAHFEHLGFLLPTPQFRLRGDGIGVGPEIRRHRSNELGQAFCRVFLHDYLGITYFAHMAQVLDRSAQSPFGGVRVERIQSGDTPDYLCAAQGPQVFLAEAKGRYPSVSFQSREFETWRQQFCRVLVRSADGRVRSIKGYIIATRFGTETRPRLTSTLYAEDPESPGDGGLDEESSAGLRNIVVGLHYGGIASKLNQPILGNALSSGFLVPEEIRFPATVWEFLLEPMRGMRFIGGYFSPQGALPIRKHGDRLYFGPPDPFRLDVGRGTFFGVEESVFRQMTVTARSGSAIEGPGRQFEVVHPFYSAVSIMRDGTVLSPLDFLSPVGQADF